MRYIFSLLIFLLIFNVESFGKECEKPIIFPLISMPVNNPDGEYSHYNWLSEYGKNQAVYKSYRIRESSSRNIVKKSLHASRDLYTDVFNDNGKYYLMKSKNVVVAVSDGVVLDVRPFYAGTYQIIVDHTTCDGRSFVIRYGELDSKSIRVKKGEKVSKGEPLGRPGFLYENEKDGGIRAIDVIADKVVFMLHIEYFTDNKSTEAYSKAFSDNRFDRRKDLSDVIDILKEGYKNSFGVELE